MTRALFLLPLALAACATVPEAPVQAVPEPSLEALRAMPPGVNVSDLGLQSGCYVYKAPDGSFVPLTTAGGQRVCA